MIAPAFQCSKKAPFEKGTIDYAMFLLEEGLAQGATTVVFTPPSILDPVLLWPLKGPAVFWDCPGDVSVVGIGQLQMIEPMDVACEKKRRVWIEPGQIRGLHRYFGGISFCEGASHAQPWKAFGDGLFIFPRWLYGVKNHQTFLQFNFSSVEKKESLLAELKAFWTYVKTPTSISWNIDIEHISMPDIDDWSSSIVSLLETIHSSKLEKVVLSSATNISLSRKIDLRILLTQFQKRFPSCTSFALQLEETAFVGASPEHVLKRDHHRITSEILAGSAHPSQGFELITSSKDLYEHSLVVGATKHVLEPLCSDLHIDKTPSLYRLPYLTHLRTVINAALNQDITTVDLLHAMHPSPAVGGVPKDMALEWIDHHEPPRGWYAAPFGWLDLESRASFVLTIRSCLIQPSKAWIFAGCGIVAGSNPTDEFRELSLKMSAVLDIFRDYNHTSQVLPSVDPNARSSRHAGVGS